MPPVPPRRITLDQPGVICDDQHSSPLTRPPEPCLSRYQASTAEQIEQSVAAGAAAAEAWGRQLLETRVAAVRRLANILRQQKGTFAQLVTAEMGKPLGEAADELEKSAVTAEYYADQAASILGDEKVEIPDVEAWVSYEAIGLVLAVMPWNYPVWQVMRFAIPSVTAGNGVPSSTRRT